MMQYVPNDVATYAMGMAASMGQFPAYGGRARQAVRPPARADPDAPAVRRDRRHGVGHQDPGGADAVHQADRCSSAPRTTPPSRSSRSSGTRTANRWFTAEEAKEYGFVDRVIRSAVEVPTEGVVS